RDCSAGIERYATAREFARCAESSGRDVASCQSSEPMMTAPDFAFLLERSTGSEATTSATQPIPTTDKPTSARCDRRCRCKCISAFHRHFFEYTFNPAPDGSCTFNRRGCPTRASVCCTEVVCFQGVGAAVAAGLAGG